MKTLPRVILALLSVILAILLAVTSLYAAALYTIRSHYTPEYIYNFMNSLDYASIEIPDGNGSSGTLCDLANNTVADFGIQFTENDLNTVIRTLSIDTILTSFVQDLRTWAFDDGAIPTLNADEMADTILSGIDRNVLMFLSMYGDVETLLSDSLSNITAAADLSESLEKAEPVREMLSEGTLIFVLSVCGTLILLILVTRQLKIAPAAIFCGSSWIVSGCVLLLADKLAAPFVAEIVTEIPKSTFDLVYIPLVNALEQTGSFLSLGGLAIVVVFAVVSSLIGMVRREKQKTAAIRAEREAKNNTYYNN